jgi:hypothetical protein
MLLKILNEAGGVVHPYNSRYSGDKLHLEAGPGKIKRPYPKNRLKAKRAGGVVQVAEHLLSKDKALNLIISIAKKYRFNVLQLRPFLVSTITKY